jgi:hypothetical protein
MKATTVRDVEKKYKITLDAPKEMLLKTFLQNLGYKSLIESVSGMRTATEESMAREKLDMETLLNQIEDFGLQLNAIKLHLGIDLRRNNGYQVTNYEDMIIKPFKRKKWYQFWK